MSVTSTLGGEWDRASAGSRDFPKRRPDLGKTGRPIFLLGSHFLNIERARGDSMVSGFSRASNGEVTGGRSDGSDMGCDGPAGGVSSSQGWSEEARDRDSSSINNEVRED